jgi:hypothetical protein
MRLESNSQVAIRFDWFLQVYCRRLPATLFVTFAACACVSTSERSGAACRYDHVTCISNRAAIRNAFFPHYSRPHYEQLHGQHHGLLGGFGETLSVYGYISRYRMNSKSSRATREHDPRRHVAVTCVDFTRRVEVRIRTCCTVFTRNTWVSHPHLASRYK